MKTFLNKLQIESLHIYKQYKNNFIVNILLQIASYVFLLLYKLRFKLYQFNILKTVKLPAYVVSIGNLTTGGTGKTPVAIELAKYFLNLGHKVAILSRGYKASYNHADGVLLVSDGEDIVTDYDRAGDEPYLIAKEVPKALVLINKDRVLAGQSAIKLGADVLILDDGFQYLKLHRDENIVLLDSYAPFDNGHLLPRGKLRELPESLIRSTAIIISNCDRKKLQNNELKILDNYSKGLQIEKISYKLNSISGINTKKTLTLKDIKGLKAIACCGIGNPESFLDLLARNEINILSYLAYPDHFDYQYEDIEQMTTLAKKYNVEDIIVTSKDAIKIEDLCQAAPISFWKTNIEVVWDSLNPFNNILQKKDKLKFTSTTKSYQ
ncbi:MAG: tetraacyldisaccharide 4'-kinase [Candidatus Melainabacteria bacterium]|nr:tetraacyldisaccharide 4'-kinase [Candidatus Melainabacteria bacterium]